MKGIFEKFELYFPHFLDVLTKINDVFLTLLRTLILTVGIPAILIAIMYVEIPRVSKGIQFFEENIRFADMSALVLVLTNKVVEFLIVYQNRKYGWPDSIKYSFSIRVFLRRITAFFFGKQRKSPAYRYESISSLVLWSILILALLGSMRSAIHSVDGMTWYTGIEHILVASSLGEIIAWIGGLFFAFTLVTTDQGIANYISIYTADVLVKMRITSEEIADTIVSREGIATEDKRIKRLPDGRYIATSSLDGWTKEYENFDRASAGIRSHDAFVSRKEDERADRLRG